VDNANAELSPTFTWPNPDFARLEDAIRRLVEPSMPTGAVFSGKIGLPGAVKLSLAYADYPTWAAAIGSDTETISANWRSKDFRQTISINTNDRGRLLFVRINVPEPDVPWAQGLIDQLRRELDLQDPAQVAPRANSVSLEKTYLYLKSETPDWCIDMAREVVGETSPNVNATLELGSPMGLNLSFASVAEWIASVRANWPSLAKFQISRFGTPEGRSVRWDSRSAKLQVRAELLTDQQVLDWFDRFEKKWQLEDSTSSDERQLEGRQRFFFAPKNPAADWFDTGIVADFMSYLRPDFFISLTARSVTEKSGTRSWENIALWRTFVIANWKDIFDFRCHMSGRGLSLSINYEHLRERVTMDVRAATMQTADDIATSLAKSLALTEIDRSNDWQVRTTASYTVARFANAEFAAELDSVIHFLFPGKHLLQQALIFAAPGKEAQDRDKLETRTYTELRRFLDDLAVNPVSMEVILRLEGPRGEVLAIHLFDKHTRLEIRSSRDPEQYKSVFKPLEERLQLTGKSVTSTVPEKPALRDSWKVQVLLPILLALAGGTLLQDAFRKWVLPVYHLEILSPDRVKAPTDIEVRWNLRREQFGRNGVDDPGLATIELIHDAKEYDRELCVPSGKKLHLAAGLYTLTITSCSVSESAKFEFEVK
jgi:hypothetical protein